MGAYGKKHNIAHFSLVVDICTFAFYTLGLVKVYGLGLKRWFFSRITWSILFCRKALNYELEIHYALNSGWIALVVQT